VNLPPPEPSAEVSEVNPSPETMVSNGLLTRCVVD
jgi:hypothetical protein